MNDAMSAGMHRLWKDQLVETLGPMRGTTIVDLAGGTGDVAFRIMEKLRHQPVPRGDGFDTRLVSGSCTIEQLCMRQGHPIKRFFLARVAHNVDMLWLSLSLWT